MRTNCCHSKHYQSENQAIVCLNQNCSNYLGQTDSFSYRSFNRFTGALLFVFILCFCENDYSSVNHDREAIAAKSYLNHKRNVLCNAETLKAEIKENGIICPEEVYAQIVIESGHMSSFLFKRANNLLGMRYPFRRPTTAIGIYLPEEDAIIRGTKEELKNTLKRINMLFLILGRIVLMIISYGRKDVLSLLTVTSAFLNNTTLRIIST